MQRVVGPTMDEAWRRRKFRGRIDRDHDRPFQPLRAVDRDQLDRLVRGVDAALGALLAGFPIRLQVPDEGLKARYIVGARHLDQGVEIGERPRAATSMSRGENDAELQAFDRLGKQYARGGPRCATPKMLKHLLHLPRDRIRDPVQRCPDIEVGRAGSALGGSDFFGDIQQFLVGQSDHGPTHECAEGKRVARVGERTKQS